jgi:hypothetical protein
VKTFTLMALISVLFINVNSISTQEVFWSDDFSDSSKWSVGNFGNNEANWFIDTVPPTFKDEYKIKSPTSSNGFALFDSWGYCGLYQEAYIEPKEKINCSGFSNIRLEFQQIFADHYDSCIVQITTNNWETHENIFINQHVQLDYVTQTPDTVSLDISNLVDGEPAAHFAILFVHASQECGFFWMIDDVKLIGTPTFSNNAPVIESLPEFSIYPIPARESLSIRAKESFMGTIILRVIGISGKNLLQTTVQTNHDDLIRLDLSELEAGTYILCIQGQDRNPAYIKFIKN